ncbi:MAG: class I SAM-dependent methyltransferase [Victivallales bacterium]|nr:class I SAM-dependent methyltransferase [Victivallales bacterium]MCF7889528.1 class I SAM-dependent methyltransferase [Victivallales bacterium]
MKTYKLLDSGNLEKLEQAGPYRLIRPAPNAYWPPSLDKEYWNEAAGHYFRSSKGGGYWKWKKKLPKEWTVHYDGFKLICKPTDFGHIGFFPEQKETWNWLSGHLSGKQNLNALNLFAYSGGSSLAMAKTGIKVCHLDAAKGMIDWAKDNLRLNSEIPDNIRWITDDVNKFIMRELRRKSVYQGIVLDPPSFGRGSRGQIWKIEHHLLPLLKNCRKLMGRNPEFMVLSMHSYGYSPISLERILSSILPDNGTVSSGEMLINEDNAKGKKLPAGIFAMWVKKNRNY